MLQMSVTYMLIFCWKIRRNIERKGKILKAILIAALLCFSNRLSYADENGSGELNTSYLRRNFLWFHFPEYPVVSQLSLETMALAAGGAV